MPLRVVVSGENGRSRARVNNAPVAWAASYMGPRQENQDYYGRADQETPGYDWQDLGCLYVLADGMGGLASGAQAARMAVKDVIEHYRHSRSEVPVAQSLSAAIEEANRKIYSAGQGKNARMGSTIVACVLKNGRATVAHAGDSRAYLLRDGELFRCTTDHLYATEVLGIKDDDDAKKSSEGHKITRALGKDAEIKVDTDENEHTPEDRFLLCSDGISEVLQDVEIRTCLAEPTPQKAVQALIASAGTRLTDNATAVVVFASGQKLRRKKTVKRVCYSVAATLLLAVATFGGYKYGSRGIATIVKLTKSWTNTEPTGPSNDPASKPDMPGETRTENRTADGKTPDKLRSSDAGARALSKTSAAGVRRGGRETRDKTASAADPKNAALPAVKQANSWKDHEIDTTQRPPAPLGVQSRDSGSSAAKSGAAQPPTAPATTTQPPVPTAENGKQPLSNQTGSAMSTPTALPQASAAQSATPAQHSRGGPKPSIISTQNGPGTTTVPRPPERPVSRATQSPEIANSQTTINHQGSTRTASVTIQNKTGEDVEIRGGVGTSMDKNPTLHVDADETRSVSYTKWIAPPERIYWRKAARHLKDVPIFKEEWQHVPVENDGAVLTKKTDISHESESRNMK